MDQYKVLLDDELKLVRVIAYGDLTKSLGKEIITEARKLAAASRYGILYDVRNATVRVALAEWFFLPRELEVLQTQPTRSVKVAVLIPPEQMEEYKFYENVTSNIGLSVKIFLDEDEAIAWMT